MNKVVVVLMLSLSLSVGACLPAITYDEYGVTKKEVSGLNEYKYRYTVATPTGPDVRIYSNKTYELGYVMVFVPREKAKEYK